MTFGSPHDPRVSTFSDIHMSLPLVAVIVRFACNSYTTIVHSHVTSRLRFVVPVYQALCIGPCCFGAHRSFPPSVRTIVV